MTRRELPLTLGTPHPLEHHPRLADRCEARVLAYRVDAFYLAFQGALRDDVRAELEVLHAKALASKTEVAVNLTNADGGELRGALSTRCFGGMWRTSSAWLTVVVDERASHDWRVEVRPTALLLMLEGPRAALVLARAAARAVLQTVTGERVRRLDLCADLVAFDLRGVQQEHFVTHHRRKSADISTQHEYSRRGIRTGFLIGKGDAQVGIYDKTEHLRLGLDETKAEEERAEWHHGGWNGLDDVTRVEYRMRGRLLDELEIRDPDRCLDRLDAVWGYCTTKWLRLVDRSTATRKERCRSDHRWRALEAVVFVARAEPAKRRRPPATPHALRQLSASLNYAACVGALGGVAGDARTHVANWSNARAEAWIQEDLFRWAQLTARAAAQVWIGRYDDAVEAAAALIEKKSAAVAKYGPGIVKMHESKNTAAAAA
jgi:hypothetical protein